MRRMTDWCWGCREGGDDFAYYVAVHNGLVAEVLIRYSFVSDYKFASFWHINVIVLM